MFHKLALALAGAGLLVTVTACTTHVPKPAAPTPQNASTKPSSMRTGDASPTAWSKSLAILTCQDGERSSAAEPTQGGLGVSSDVWGGDATWSLDAFRQFSSGGKTFVKSPLYVSSSAQPGTVVRVISPRSAGLFYTSFGVWTQPQGVTTSGLISAARRQVQIRSCSDDSTQMYPGGYVVTGPSCVVIEITRPGGRRHVVKASLGKPCR